MKPLQAETASSEDSTLGYILLTDTQNKSR